MNMPWHNKRIQDLNQMSSRIETSPLKLFLDKHCLDILKLLEGDRGIPIEYKDPKVLLTLQDTTDLSSQYKPEHFNKLSKLCTYVFFLFRERKVTQCGSTIRLVN